MKKKVYLNEQTLQRLVENCVYDMLNEDVDEGLWGGVSNVAKQGWNKAKQFGQNFGAKAKQFGQNVSNAYQQGSQAQDQKIAFNKAVKMYQKYAPLFAQYNQKRNALKQFCNQNGIDMQQVINTAKGGTTPDGGGNQGVV